VEIIVVEGDFNNKLDLPPLDGIVIANALHYAKDHLKVLNNMIGLLKSGGRFIIVEYDTDAPNAPWVPYPVSFNTYQSLCRQTGLSQPKLVGTTQSRYGYEQIYASVVEM
jgi:SAM-dependent methyltransferase